MGLFRRMFIDEKPTEKTEERQVLEVEVGELKPETTKTIVEKTKTKKKAP